MKTFNPKSLVAKAMKASKLAKISTHHNKAVRAYVKLYGVSTARAEAEVWLLEEQGTNV